MANNTPPNPYWDSIRRGSNSGIGAGIGGALLGPLGAGVGALFGGSQGGGGNDAQSAWDNRPDPYAGAPALPTDVTGGVSRDSTGLDKFKQEAFRTGPSNWAKLSTAQQGMNATNARNAGTAEVGSQEAKGEDR